MWCRSSAPLLVEDFVAPAGDERAGCLDGAVLEFLHFLTSVSDLGSPLWLALWPTRRGGSGPCQGRKRRRSWASSSPAVSFSKRSALFSRLCETSYFREKKSKKFRDPWLVRRVLRDDRGHKVMTQGRALATEVNEGTRMHRTHRLSKPGQKKTNGETTPRWRDGMSAERHRHIQPKCAEFAEVKRRLIPLQPLRD